MSTEPNTPEENPDASPYIRTFAKDFAALSGKPVEDKTIENKKKHPAKKEKPLKKKHEVLERQTETTIANEQATTKPEDFSELELRGEKLEQNVQNNIGDLAASKHPETIESLPRIGAGDIVSQEIPDRSSDILARLKARALENKENASTLKPIVPIAPVTQIEPIVPPREESPSPLHTYTTDFEDHIHEEHASPFSVLAAEKDAATPMVTRPVPQKKRGGNLVPVAGGILLLMLGIGAVSAGAYISMSKNAVVSVPTPTSLIIPDSTIQLSGSGSNLLAALAQESAQPIPNNSVVLTYVNESTTTPQGVVEEPASGGALITELSLPAPDILLRNIDPQSMVGIVSAGGETRPFFILRVESYERTFAGMLAWEPTMFKNLSPLYPLYPIQVVTSATQSSASTTKSSAQTQINIPVANSNLPVAQFIDETVASHDVRALKDNSGHTLVLYGYADKQTLIIARNESAFSLILSRL